MVRLLKGGWADKGGQKGEEEAQALIRSNLPSTDEVSVSLSAAEANGKKTTAGSSQLAACQTNGHIYTTISVSIWVSYTLAEQALHVAG